MESFRKKLAILLILMAGMIAIVPALASNTIVDNTSVSTTTVNTVDSTASNSMTTKDLTVTGTCTGCGGGGSSEGTYTSYNAILYNVTFVPTTGLYPDKLLVSNTGATTVHINSGIILVTSNGTVIDIGQTYSPNMNAVPIDQSMTGKYKIMESASGTGSILVYKNDSLLTTIFPEAISQFNTNDLSFTGIAISPDAHYIALYGANNSTSGRMIVFQGSP